MKDTNDKQSTTRVNVPITITVKVPVDVAMEIDESLKNPDETLGCQVVDPTKCPDAVNSAVDAASLDESCCAIFDGLLATAMRLQQEHPESTIYASPFAGVVKETKIA
jgi:hypothetical protein